MRILDLGWADLHWELKVEVVKEAPTRLNWKRRIDFVDLDAALWMLGPHCDVRARLQFEFGDDVEDRRGSRCRSGVETALGVAAAGGEEALLHASCREEAGFADGGLGKKHAFEGKEMRVMELRTGYLELADDYGGQ